MTTTLFAKTGSNVNFRSSPEIKPDNIIELIPQETEVLVNVAYNQSQFETARTNKQWLSIIIGNVRGWMRADTLVFSRIVEISDPVPPMDPFTEQQVVAIKIIAKSVYLDEIQSQIEKGSMAVRDVALSLAAILARRTEADAADYGKMMEVVRLIEEILNVDELTNESDLPTMPSKQ